MKSIIVDERISEKCERSLLIKGFNLIKLPADCDLGEAVSSHPDTVMFFSGNRIITTADYCDKAAYIFADIREFAPNVKITFTSDKRCSLYPKDCIMNALVIGDRIFCKKDNVSKAILDYAKSEGYKIIGVNQGYPACSTLAFGNNAITADRGMAKTLSDEGIDVLLINEGHISLPPYSYGFIGGAGGVYNNVVYFFGNLDLHPDASAIGEFIRSKGFSYFSLSDEPLSDFGGFFAL